ncbi:MAG: 4-hydroxy-tetrahydrodipicolinate reductase, partial [Phycisphaeraceae bacterium]|nr:4-hydroxy-tetrahydrodipicolinate reductase [Phycisphaeraceae bacterium]
MRYAIVGFGRMGREVDRLARSRGHQRVALLDPGETEEQLDPGSLDGADVAFEFTVPDAAHRNVLSLVRADVPVVCGTTGWKQSPELDN